jgi:hypothetical protein
MGNFTIQLDYVWIVCEILFCLFNLNFFRWFYIDFWHNYVGLSLVIFTFSWFLNIHKISAELIYYKLHNFCKFILEMIEVFWWSVLDIVFFQMNKLVSVDLVQHPFLVVNRVRKTRFRIVVDKCLAVVGTFSAIIEKFYLYFFSYSRLVICNWLFLVKINLEGWLIFIIRSRIFGKKPMNHHV